jgi:hypothetical protein
METDPRIRQTLETSIRGKCGHVRHDRLPCATPGCKEGVSNLVMFGIVREEVEYNGENVWIWLSLKK